MTTSSRHTYAFDDVSGSFSVNSQRPPVPGEENDQSQKHGNNVCDKSVLPSSKKNADLASRGSAPGIPRRLAFEVSAKASADAAGAPAKLERCDSSDAPLGFEPEGSTTLSANFQESSNSSGTPSYLKWAENFNYLLQDSDGVKLFQEFLYDQEENCGCLDFWFACSGLKMIPLTDADSIAGLVKLIYKKYIKGNTLRLKPDIKRRVIERMKRERIDQTIFNEAQVEIENIMRNDMYPLFLKSDIYLQFVQVGDDSPKPSHSSNSSESMFPGSGIGKLPTVHEEEELKSDNMNDDDVALQYLTQGTPKVRAGVPSDRCYGVTYPGYKSRVSNPYHISYTTVSAQDSELQSLSSDALTDDTMSYTDSSVDGREYVVHRNKMVILKQAKVMRHNADTTQHTGLNQHFIPRTQLVKPDCNLAEKDPPKFASLLIEQLLKVTEEQERQERFVMSMKSIQDTDDESGLSTSQCRSCLPKSAAFNNTVGSFPFTSMLFASAMANNSDHEDNAQSILDDHVSHIWNSSGVTPSRSPGRMTPDHMRRDPGLLMHSSVPKSRLKEISEQQLAFACSKDGKFVYPSSSKNQPHSGKDHRLVSSKDLEQSRRFPSASVPNSALVAQGKSASALPARCSAEDTRHAAARQGADAGVGMAATGGVEASAAERHPIPLTEATNERVLMWMLDNEKYCESRAHCSTDCSDKGSSNKRSSHKSAGKKGSNHKTNRSESLDQNKHSSVPAADFGSCPQRALNQSNVALRLDELKQALTEDTKTPFSKPGLQGKTKTTGEGGDGKRQEYTVIGYYFCDEPIPYRTMIPGRNVTLGQLKQLIAKKGNYRYFFKKVCHDFESGVVHEEITCDDDVLPLWDGKVVCKVERLT